MLASPGQVRAARSLLGWSQGQLARAAGISRRSISEFESGRFISEQGVASLVGALRRAGVELSVEATELRLAWHRDIESG